jgi:hypothetical protein
MRLVVLAAALLVVGCTSADNLKPGVSRGTMEARFTKTTEGLQLEVRGRSYDQVWDAVERAVAWAGKEPGGLYQGPLKVVDRQKDRGAIRTEEPNSLGLTRAYVGVFVTPPRNGADVYTVEVTKIMKNRTEVVQGRNWEADLLRAIDAVLKTQAAVPVGSTRVAGRTQ